MSVCISPLLHDRKIPMTPNPRSMFPKAPLVLRAPQCCSHPQVASEVLWRQNLEVGHYSNFTVRILPVVKIDFGTFGNKPKLIWTIMKISYKHECVAIGRPWPRGVSGIHWVIDTVYIEFHWYPLICTIDPDSNHLLGSCHQLLSDLQERQQERQQRQEELWEQFVAPEAVALEHSRSPSLKSATNTNAEMWWVSNVELRDDKALGPQVMFTHILLPTCFAF